MKSKIIVALAASALLALAGTAAAYHDGGVAECEGCHTMHNSLGGAEMAANAPGLTNGNNKLLQGSDASSTCLNCHGDEAAKIRSYKMFTTGVGGLNNGSIPASYTPGGDFAWLTKDYQWVAHSTTYDEFGEEHGHSVVAYDYGLDKDSRFTTAPGGTFPAADLGCNSCHDPHGKYRKTTEAAPDTYQSNFAGGTLSVLGTDTIIDPIRESGSYGAQPLAGEAVGVYRLLAGPQYKQLSGALGADRNITPGFTAVPDAVAPSSYNKTGASSPNAWQVRVAYKSGWSQWCATCHADIASGANHHEVTAPLANATPYDTGVSYADIYNGYVASGNLSGDFGTLSGPYSSLVPFQDDHASNVASGNFTATAAEAAGPSGSAQISCLTCHRAHASGHQSATRWTNRETMFIAEGVYGGTDGANTDIRDLAMGRTQAETKASYYNMPEAHFATYQRSLCNKCHAKD